MALKRFSSTFLSTHENIFSEKENVGDNDGDDRGDITTKVGCIQQ